MGAVVEATAALLGDHSFKAFAKAGQPERGTRCHVHRATWSNTALGVRLTITAAQLLAEYGDLDTLLARAEEIKQPKRRETLTTMADQIRLSKTLVTLDQFEDAAEKLDSDVYAELAAVYEAGGIDALDELVET